MTARMPAFVLAALIATATAPTLTGQQAQQVGFWKKSGSAIHNKNAGNVGIGTTTPTAKLDVDGTARVSGTLTLAPSGDQALDVNTGSIYKGGTLFIHTRGGLGLTNTALGLEALANVAPFVGFPGPTQRNTAIGFAALYENTTGGHNTAIGNYSLTNNTTGSFNTAIGTRSLRSTSSGRYNVAVGENALFSNTTGYYNAASGAGALLFNTTGNDNTATGTGALYYNTTGHRNIAVGYGAGKNLTTGNDNIAIGNKGIAAESNTIRIGNSTDHTRAFLAGIRGVTTDVADAVTVMIDSAGQLGTVSSSRRFKEDIQDMGDATDRLLELRPVAFRYREHVAAYGDSAPTEYGLIAEEVADVFPELVVYDDEGRPETVKYHLLSSMLLNELQKQAEELQEQRERDALQSQRISALERLLKGDSGPAAALAGG